MTRSVARSVEVAAISAEWRAKRADAKRSLAARPGAMAMRLRAELARVEAIIAGRLERIALLHDPRARAKRLASLADYLAQEDVQDVLSRGKALPKKQPCYVPRWVPSDLVATYRAEHYRAGDEYAAHCVRKLKRERAQ